MAKKIRDSEGVIVYGMHNPKTGELENFTIVSRKVKGTIFARTAAEMGKKVAAILTLTK